MRLVKSVVVLPAYVLETNVKPHLKYFVLLLISFLSNTACANTGRHLRANEGIVLMGWDIGRIDKFKNEFKSGKLSNHLGIKKLVREAEDALTAQPLSVFDKAGLPPSGSKKDFMNVGIFLWPTPESPDGMPYVYKDGETNPANVRDFPDWDNFLLTNGRIRVLSLAAYITGDERFANKAIELLKAWYTDAKTGMNPHLNFAHSWPGKHSGDPAGGIILEGTYKTLDSVTLLRALHVLDPATDIAFRQWVKGLASWWATGEFGKAERAGRSNHSTHYSGTMAAMYFFLGENDSAREMITEARDRISWQIEPDGKQPKELTRTISLHYSIYNIQGYVFAARMGKLLGVDIWKYETTDGRSLKKAIDYVAEPAMGLRQWPHRQIKPYEPFKRFGPILRQAFSEYGDTKYNDLYRRFDRDWIEASQDNLVLADSLN